MSISNISFGKSPLLTCKLKSMTKNETADATLYKLDVTNTDDLNDVKYSKYTSSIKRQFERDNMYGGYSDYYLLQKNDTNEVLGCMQTSTHYSHISKNEDGKAIIIDEMSSNDKYFGANEVMFSYLAHDANDRFCDYIISSYEKNIVPHLSSAKFSKTAKGDDYIKKTKFQNIENQGTDRYQINFEV